MEKSTSENVGEAARFYAPNTTVVPASRLPFGGSRVDEPFIAPKLSENDLIFRLVEFSSASED
jgi:hypothetical protein